MLPPERFARIGHDSDLPATPDNFGPVRHEWNGSIEERK